MSVPRDRFSASCNRRHMPVGMRRRTFVLAPTRLASRGTAIRTGNDQRFSARCTNFRLLSVSHHAKRLEQKRVVCKCVVRKCNTALQRPQTGRVRGRSGRIGQIAPVSRRGLCGLASPAHRGTRSPRGVDCRAPVQRVAGERRRVSPANHNRTGSPVLVLPDFIQNLTRYLVDQPPPYRPSIDEHNDPEQLPIPPKNAPMLDVDQHDNTGRNGSRTAPRLPTDHSSQTTASRSCSSASRKSPGMPFQSSRFKRRARRASSRISEAGRTR